eukprot:CAMPEP_0174251406 /NCGR_PEP_ID=MMETSP0439-20130205/1237_1 /TAXON_ID=0 /ORGANISM="Stereomyxa ramosa, Strain Chinc5" /LENGTH=221 /DNA_ID=CAMNT_0015331705 /DNA_START=44 /DNA_END=709 /DNA_ORIENTATION=+
MGNTQETFENCQFVELDKPMHVMGFDKHIHDKPKHFRLKEKIFSFTGDDFTILDEQENVCFKMEGKVFSLRQRKELLDSSGEKLGMIKHKALTMHKRIYVLNNNQEVVMVAKRRHFFQFTVEVDVWILRNPLTMDSMNKNETDNREPDIQIEGNWRAKNLLMHPPGDTSACYAKVQRHGFNARNLVWGKDTYALSVAPLVDCAACVMLVVVLDEMYRDEEN